MTHTYTSPKGACGHYRSIEGVTHNNQASRNSAAYTSKLLYVHNSSSEGSREAATCLHVSLSDEKTRTACIPTSGCGNLAHRVSNFPHSSRHAGHWSSSISPFAGSIGLFDPNLKQQFTSQYSAARDEIMDRSARVSCSECRKRSAVQALARSRTARRSERRGLRMAGDESSVLEEQPVSADEAIALIDKAKTIVEADMGVKVCGLVHVTRRGNGRAFTRMTLCTAVSYGMLLVFAACYYTRRCRVAYGVCSLAAARLGLLFTSGITKGRTAYVGTCSQQSVKLVTTTAIAIETLTTQTQVH